MIGNPEGYQKLHSWGVLLGITVVLMGAPVPLGSNRPYAWFALVVFVYALLLFWAGGRLVLGPDNRQLKGRDCWILAGLVVWLGFIFLQTIELPESVVKALSPFAFSMQQNLALINIQTPSSLSIDAGKSYNELLKYGAYVGSFFLVLVTATTRRRLLAVVGVLIIAGVLEALFGLYVGASGYTVFPEIGESADVRAGTFVNSHHFATMLMLVFCVAAGVTAGVANTRPEANGSSELKYFAGGSWRATALLAAAVIMLVAVIAAGAWPTVVFAGLAFSVMLLLAARSRRVSRGERLVARVMIGVAVVVLAGAVIKLGFDSLWSREWFLQNKLGLGMLKEVWLTGVGAGNYEWGFQMFRDDSIRFATYDHALNDYLESAIEQGLPAMIVLGTVVGTMLHQLYRGYRSRRNALMRGIIFGCLAGMIYMLLYAAVGFNFRIPANAVYFFVIAALGLAASRVDRGQRVGTSSSKQESEDL